MRIEKLRNAFILLTAILASVALAGCSGGDGGSSGSSSGGPSDGATTTTSTKPTISLALASGLPATDSNRVTLVTYGSPIYAVATVKNANGAAVANAVVTFATVNSLIRFDPASASAVTGNDGKASIKLDVAGLYGSGIDSLTASADVTTTSSGTSSTATYISAPLGVATNGTKVTLGSLTLGQSSISAYGTSVVTVPVLIRGVATYAPIAVTFTSPCVTRGKATLSSPVTAVYGTATAIYKDDNCGPGGDVITASVGDSSVNATINVAAPSASNLRFISATPATIGIQGAGSSLQQNSSVKFKVVDASNNGKPGVAVSFSLSQTPGLGGATLETVSATSDVNGEVTARVTAGSVPMPVSVVASISQASGATATSQSNALTVTTGIPAQDFFWLSVQTTNIEGLAYDGITSALTVIASDRVGNPVPDGTAVNFITEGGQIVPPSCITTNGTCSVTFKSAQYKPADGRVTVLAYASGEKGFNDANGNGMYDSGETFYDLGDPFIDANENGLWDSGNAREQSLNFAVTGASAACLTRYGNGTTDPLPSNYYNALMAENGRTPSVYTNALSVQNTCSGTWNGGKAYVRRSAVLILSGSTPVVSQSRFSTLSMCWDSLVFNVSDVNGNPLPVGTTIALGEENTVTYTTDEGEAANVLLRLESSPTVPNSDSITQVRVGIAGGSRCHDHPPLPGSAFHGSFNVVFKTPQGVESSVTMTLTGP